MKEEHDLDEVTLRDSSYNQIIHMVTAAKGAEDFYTTDHSVRSEDIGLARKLDTMVAEVRASQWGQYTSYCYLYLIMVSDSSGSMDMADETGQRRI